MRGISSVQYSATNPETDEYSNNTLTILIGYIDNNTDSIFTEDEIDDRINRTTFSQRYLEV